MPTLAALLPIWLALAAPAPAAPTSPAPPAPAGPASLAAPAPAAPPAPPPTRRLLANGLEVILQRDTRLPLIAVHLVYHVGAVDDPPHRRGLAHVVEHLMFEGSRHIDAAAREAARGRAAVHHDNAETDLHSSEYFTLAPRGSLATVLWLESDRMGFLRGHAGVGTLARVQAIVAQERRQRRETDPRGARIDRLFGELYPPEHPYHDTVMGPHAAIAAVTLADIDVFLAAHYAPRNATLTIVGDLPPDTDALIDHHFAGLRSPAPSDSLRPPVLPARSDPQVRPRRPLPPVSPGPPKIVRIPGGGPPGVLCGWPSPGVHAEGDAALDVMFAALEAGAFLRLAGPDAATIAAFHAQQVSQPGQSIALAELHGQTGADPARLHDALLRVLGQVADGALGPAELRRASLRLATRLEVVAQDLGTRAALLSGYAADFGDPDALTRDQAQWLAVSPEDVAHAARTLLSARTAAILSGPP